MDKQLRTYQLVRKVLSGQSQEKICYVHSKSRPHLSLLMGNRRSLFVVRVDGKDNRFILYYDVLFSKVILLSLGDEFSEGTTNRSTIVSSYLIHAIMPSR